MGTLFWKVIFSFIPPAAIGKGYPCFVVSIAMIGACTALIGDIAGHLGCFIFLRDSVNAIAFVALGTSVPDTFASKIAAIYHEANGNQFNVPVGSLGFSVTIFCIEALLAIFILMLRRHPAVGGELGGPKSVKTITAAIFVCFWCFYVFISALEAYGVIVPGF